MKACGLCLFLCLCLVVSSALAVEEPLPFVENLLTVAKGELGYEEGRNNYSKYGLWSGDAYAAWCAEFLGWCVDQTDQRYGSDLLNVIYPNYTGQNTGRDWFIDRGRFVYRNGLCPGWGYQWMLGESAFLAKNAYIPYPGDWVFFSLNNDDTVHVAMVTHTSTKDESILVHVIEGNNPSAVETKTYNLTDPTILGYGTPVKRVGTTMRFGNEGEAVLALQNLLVSIGFLEEKQASGTYGSHTRAAVTSFQALYLPEKTSSRGIADLETQAALACAYEALLLSDPNTWLVTE